MDARLVASRLPGIAMYGQPFNSPHFPGYIPYPTADASAFYSPLPTGENADAWRAGLTQAAAYYDPALAAHYGYGYGPMGLSDGARRKNATRETTSTLKAWLNEHRKNPYPTKGEKIMLAIITKMTLTQVSTWFANARRRLKKENKMTWSPRNRCGEDDDDDVMDGDDDSNLNNNSNIQGLDGQPRETNSSRCSSPTQSNIEIGNSDGQARVSSFDLPHQGAHHPFLPRPDINGSFSMRGPNGIGGGGLRSGESTRRRSHVDDDEEIDLESVDDERKESAFVKRPDSKEDRKHLEGNSQSGAQRSLSGFFSNAPPHPSFNPSASNPALNSVAAASFLARHHLQPHGLSPMNSDPRNQAQKLYPSLEQHPSSFGPIHAKSTPRRSSTSPNSHPYSRNNASSPTSSVASASSAISSPSKPKIWSLADVATSNEGIKNTGPSNMTTSTPTSAMNASPTPGMAVFNCRPGMNPGMPPHQSPLNQDGLAQATIRNWMDGVMQQKMAAAAAAAAMSAGQPHPPFFPGGLLPQHLAAALNPAALAVAASLPRGGDGARFQHPFHGFAELAAAQRAQMAAHVAELQSQHSPTHPTSSAAVAIPHSSSKTTLVLPRHRMISSHDEKVRSPISVSSPHSNAQPVEVSGFTALNTRPDSSDSGIVSAETSKDSLAQGIDSSSSGTK